MHIIKRKDSGIWWFNITAQNGSKLQISSGTKNKDEALEFYKQKKLGLWDKSLLRKNSVQKERKAFRAYRDNTEPLKKKMNKGYWLNKDQANKLLAELPEYLENMVRLTLLTGVYKVNLLTWKDVNLTDKTLTHGSPRVIKKYHPTIKLSDEALQIILSQQGKHPEYVFTYNDRYIKNLNSVVWRKALDRAGLKPFHQRNYLNNSFKNSPYPTKEPSEYTHPGFRWHDLRHTWAVWLVQSAPQPLLLIKTNYRKML